MVSHGVSSQQQNKDVFYQKFQEFLMCLPCAHALLPVTASAYMGAFLTLWNTYRIALTQGCQDH